MTVTPDPRPPTADWLTETGAWFPPAPTFTCAFAGGIVATNAAGAATFKYGSTRDWVEALTVVLADGTVLALRRGAQRARKGRFEIETASGRVSVPVPTYRMPDVAKRSAGYHAAPDMDLIDLFIGSEGTLGVITQISFRTLSPAPNIVLAWIPCADEAQGLALVQALRNASIETRPSGLRVARARLRDLGPSLGRERPPQRHPALVRRRVKGKEAMLEFGRHVARLGGCPLAERGVGRNPVKQALLSQLYGDAGSAGMRAVKHALDPGNRLAPGVIFPAAPEVVS